MKTTIITRPLVGLSRLPQGKQSCSPPPPHPRRTLTARAWGLLSFLWLCAGLSTGFAADFCVNPGFEDGVDPAAAPWSFWGGTGGAMPNPFVDANNPSARVWSNFGNPTYVNVAAQNNMSGVWLIPGATYRIRAQYYVPASEVLPGVTARAGIYLSMMTAGNFRVLDPRYPDTNNIPPIPSASITNLDQWVTYDFNWVCPGTPGSATLQVNYGTFRLYGGDGTNLATATFPNPGGYFDNCQISSAAYTGVINGVVKNASGTLTGAAVKLSYKGNDVKTITTTGDGVFSFADLIPGESYTVAVTKAAYLAASRTATASTNLGDIVLSPDPDFDPTALVSLRAASLPVGTNLATWLNGGNLGGSFDKFSGGTGPEVKYILGKKSVEFVQTDSGANRRTMASVTPAPASLSGNNPWTISTLLYRSSSQPGGENAYAQWAGGAYADAQSAIFNYTPNRAYMHWGTGYDMGFVTMPGAGAWHNVTITYDGTTEIIYVDGLPDRTTDRSGTPLSINAGGLMLVGGRTWHDVRGEDQYWRFNGAIAWMKIFDKALTATEVSALATTTKHTITVTTGSNGSVTPGPGAISIDEGDSPTFAITPSLGYRIVDVLVDGVSNPGAVVAGSYTFSNVTAAHTLSATFGPLPPQVVSGKVTDGTNGVMGAKVYFKLTPTA